MKCTHHKTWENVHQMHRMNIQWLLSVVLRMKCTVLSRKWSGSSSNLLWWAMDMWKLTRLQLYTSNVMFLIASIFISLKSHSSLQNITGCPYIPSEEENSKLSRTQLLLPLYMVLYPKDRNLHLYHSKPLNLWAQRYFSYHHCSVVQQELFLHSDTTRCIWPLNNRIKCPNLGSELPSFCGGI